MAIIAHNGIPYVTSDLYSQRDFTGHDLSGRLDMSGIVIHGSCFSREVPGSVTFPAGMTGTTFILCNLDNCRIPAGNTVIDCSTRRFRVQNDGEDWIVDGSNVPIEPVNKKLFQLHGLSIDPADIPVGRQPRSIITRKIEEREAIRQVELARAEVIIAAGGTVVAGP